MSPATNITFFTLTEVGMIQGLNVLFIIYPIHIICCHYWSFGFIFLQAVIFILALSWQSLLNLSVFRTHCIFCLDVSRKALKHSHKVA